MISDAGILTESLLPQTSAEASAQALGARPALNLQKDPEQWIAPEEFFKNIRYVTLKLTDGCNLKCSYCNVEADLPSTPKMSLETFKRVADLLIMNSESPFVGLEFHGGEPLILEDEWYTEAVGYAQSLAKKYGKLCQHPMQTNGTKLTEERYQFLKKLGIQLGFSYDGPPHINDRLRMAGKRVEKTLKMMIENKQPFGMILVLSRANCNDMYEIMEYFREFGIVDFRVNFMQPQGWGLDQNLLSGEEMFNGMRAIFDHMHDTDCSVNEADIQLMVNRFMMGRVANPQLTCWEHECQAGRNYCAMNIRGGIYACGTDMFHHKLGDIWEGFRKDHVNRSLCELHTKDPWYVRCFSCEAKRICNMSCSTSDYNNKDYREYECDFTRRLYKYFLDNREKVERVFKRMGELNPECYQLR